MLGTQGYTIDNLHSFVLLLAEHSNMESSSPTIFATGANIESLAVGLNIDKALFTIVVTGNKSAVANLVKQLGKLVKVHSHPLI